MSVTKQGRLSDVIISGIHLPLGLIIALGIAKLIGLV